MKRNFKKQNSLICLKPGLFSLLGLTLLLLPTRVSTDVLQSGSSSSVVCQTTIKVILIQFNDVKGDQYWDGSSWQVYDNRYKMSDFEDLLTSLGTYTGFRGTDNQPVFGSFRDYFYENSRQDFSPTVNILNGTDSNGYPVWLNLSGNKSSYSSGSFLTAANAAAASAGFSTTGEVCYIYAGNWVSNIGVFANALKGNRMVVPERYDRSAVGERKHFLMTHIGYYAHEFGHLMGAHHTFTSHHHCLMHSGHKAGTKLANRLASMNPWFLYKSGWASLSFINSDMTNVSLTYNTSPTTQSTFYVRKIPGSDECFLVENRQYSNTYDQSLPGAVAGRSGGLLIWNIDGEGLNLGETDLVEADNNASEANQLEMAKDMFRPSVYWPGDINDITTPANLRLRNGTYSKFAIENFSSTGNPITLDFLIDFVAPPTNLIISNPSADGAHPILSWTASGTPDVDHYLVWRGTTPNWKTTPVTWEQNPAANVTGTTWTDNQTTIDLDVLTAMYYRLTAVDDADNESDYSNSVMTTSSIIWKTGKESLITSLPQTFALYSNFPNPFNPETQIRFDLPEAAQVGITIYNTLGKEVLTLVDSFVPAGFHQVVWKGRDSTGQEVASGVYVYRLQIRQTTSTYSTLTFTKKNDALTLIWR